VADDRSDALKKALADVLVDGDRFVVSRTKGEVEVQDAASRLKQDNPRLYGVLLTHEQAIAESGGMIFFGAILGSIGLCVALHTHLLDTVLGAREADLRSGWVYAFLIVATVIGSLRITGWFERRTYDQRREELLEEIGGAGLDRPTLLAIIDGDSSLSNVAEHLKRR
jgi:hypothetical protein